MSAGCKSLQIGYKSCLATDFNSHTQTKSHQVLLEAQRLISALILPVVGFLQVIIRGDVLCITCIHLGLYITFTATTCMLLNAAQKL